MCHCADNYEKIHTFEGPFNEESQSSNWQECNGVKKQIVTLKFNCYMYLYVSINKWTVLVVWSSVVWGIHRKCVTSIDTDWISRPPYTTPLSHSQTKPFMFWTVQSIIMYKMIKYFVHEVFFFKWLGNYGCKRNSTRSKITISFTDIGQVEVGK